MTVKMAWTVYFSWLATWLQNNVHYTTKQHCTEWHQR